MSVLVPKLLKGRVLPSCSGDTAESIHRGCPHTDRHGGFNLLRFQPGLVHPSLGNLLIPSSLETTILVSAMHRTPVRHSSLWYRTPELRQFHSLSLPEAWIIDTRHRARQVLVSSKAVTSFPSHRLSVTGKRKYRSEKERN